MTIKEKALQQAIELAVSHYACFYERGGEKLEIMRISDIQLSGYKLYPLKDLDGSNLEKCTGGRCNASFRITYQSPQDMNLQIEKIKHCENIDFEVTNYDKEKFEVKIINKRLIL